MLTLSKISKSYSQRGVVLNQLDLEVNRGETIAITGPSGSGKTTLLNMIGLLDKPDSGSILIDGTDITSYNAEQSAGYRRERVGFVFQEHLLLPHLTIKENIYLPLLTQKRGLINYPETDKYIDLLLEKTGITDIRNKYPHQVSGGEAQRGTLVRSLVNKPSMLLADEPTGSLDMQNSEILSNLLIEINSEFNTTIIAVTHSNNFAEKMGRVYQLDNGVLV